MGKALNRDISGHSGHLARGTLWGFLGAAVGLPTGLLTTAFLTRKLGPEGYGILSVTATLTLWIQVVITAGLNPAAVKFMSETHQWESVATKFFRVQLAMGILTSIFIYLTAPVIAAGLNSPALAYYIRVYSLLIPIMSANGVHLAALIGRGHYGRRAVLNALFWLFRLGFIFWLVGWRPTVTSAVLAHILAALSVFIWARCYIRPSLFAPSNFPMKKIWDYGWILFLSTVAMNTFGQLDLLFIKALSARPETAGYYGAVKNLTILPAMFVGSLAPILVNKLSLLSATGEHRSARDMGQSAISVLICLLPFAGMASGSSRAIVSFVYGNAFLPAGPLLSILIYSALGIAIMGVTTSMLVAAGRPGLGLAVILPAAGICIPALLFVMPRYDAAGAAAVINTLAWTGAAVGIILSLRVWRTGISIGLVIKSVLVGGIIHFTALNWPTAGTFLFIKLFLLTLLTLGLYLATGVIKPGGVRRLAGLFKP